MTERTDADVEAAVLAATQRWLERIVIGLNLCPFARAVHQRRQIRYVVSRATSDDALYEDLLSALRELKACDSAAVDTLLLIHPFALPEFLDYNQFLARAEAALDELDLHGVIQIASFHPRYQFAGSAADAIENYSNRSPYPMLHLLREQSVARAIAAYPDTVQIVERNIATLRQLGHAGWQRLHE